MNNISRTDNTIRNSIVGVSAQIINMLLGFVARTIFIRCLGVEYLGANALFSNILTMLSLAELGLGSAIVYNMYKPIAEGNEIKIAKLMNLYGRAYPTIGAVVAVLGLCVIPFLRDIVGETRLENLTLIYLLFLASTVASYLFAYKRSIFSADQRERVLKTIGLISYTARTIVQIIILLLWKDYIAFLVIGILFAVLENLAVSSYADRCYPFLKVYKKERLDKAELSPIIENIKSLFVYKVGGVVLDGTDSIIISAISGLANVGYLSNYALVTGYVRGFLDIISGAMTGSVGNFVAKENKQNQAVLLNRVTFLHFLIYGVTFVGSVAVLDSFIALWIGEEYLISPWVVFVHCLNIYIYGMLCGVWTFRQAMGLFSHGRWRPLISAVINIVVSIWWGKEIGYIGVLLGTTFTRISTSAWFDPYVVCRYGLETKPFRYYLKWLVYLVITLVDIGLVVLIKSFLNLPGIYGVLFYGFSAVLIFVLSVVIAFHSTDEYRYSVNLLLRLLRKKQ